MSQILNTLNSSIGKKFTMSITGLFLISFLVVHAAINALIFYNDHGLTFNKGAHFMSTNPIIRTIEIVLVLGFVVHIIQSYLLWIDNKRARPIKYSVIKSPRQVTWNSKSMTLLGTLILLFLILHLSNFWVPNRTNQLLQGKELPLYEIMIRKFSNPVEVVIYLLGIFSLYWHLLHGFSTAFQSLGISHKKYSPIIKKAGNVFSALICILFALMPLSIYFKIIT